MKQKMLSAGVVILHQGQHGWRYLLLRSYRYWDFPKGLVEPDETPFLAAQREVREETSLRDLDFSWGQPYMETAPYGAGKVARYYLATSPTDQVTLLVNPEIGRPEHEEFVWLEYSKARSLLAPRLVRVIEWAHEISGH